jgi:hypothetical protein
VQQPLHPVVALHVHTPAEHWVPIPQTIPQPPQLLLSVVSSTHWLPQGVKPVLHVKPQLPLQVALPLAGGWQATPHPPQLAMSPDSLTHDPLQAVSPAAQLSVHLLAEQDALPLPVTGGRQALAHAPQLSGSVVSSTHALPHAVPVAQPGWQLPATQETVPPVGGTQTWPQVPQLPGSV